MKTAEENLSIWSRCLAIGCAASSLTAMPSYAQDTDAGTLAETQKSAGLEEIVVTAQRKQEALQDVPIAVTAVSASQLQAKGISSSEQLEAIVPNLALVKTGSAFTPFLRGVGSNAVLATDEPSVATYVDGVYQPSPIANVMVFNNIERIEVLKGPQGTLFGRNATGGVIQVVTAEPQQDLHLKGNIGYGNYETLTASGYATGGLTPAVAADLALYYQNRGDGYGRNLISGAETHKRKDFAARTKWVLAPSDSTKATIALGYSRIDTTGNDFQLTPDASDAWGVPYPGRFNTINDLPIFYRAKSYSASLRIDQEIGKVNLVSTSSYIDSWDNYSFDDGRRVYLADFVVEDPVHSWAQEFQINGSSDILDWQLGIYLFKLKGSFDALIKGPLAGANPNDFFRSLASQDTRSVAAYGQATYNITDQWSATAGIRYTYDKQTTVGKLFVPGATIDVPEQSQSDKVPTWRLALDYQVTPDVLAYLSYNRGVKSGGYNISSPGTPGFRPEKLDAYEFGLKTELFDRHLRFNLAAFYYDYKDLQVLVIGNLGLATTQNAASARIKGFDVDFEFIPFQNFTISGGLGFLDSKYLDYESPLVYGAGGQPVLPPPDVSGKRLLNAPKFSGNLTAAYTIPLPSGHINIAATVARKSVSFASVDNRLTFPSYTLVNGKIGWVSNDERYGVDLWIKNAFDERYYFSRINAVWGDLQSEADPRTYGIRLNFNF